MYANVVSRHYQPTCSLIITLSVEHQISKDYYHTHQSIICIVYWCMITYLNGLISYYQDFGEVLIHSDEYQFGWYSFFKLVGDPLEPSFGPQSKHSAAVIFFGKW